MRSSIDFQYSGPLNSRNSAIAKIAGMLREDEVAAFGSPKERDNLSSQSVWKTAGFYIATGLGLRVPDS